MENKEKLGATNFCELFDEADIMQMDNISACLKEGVFHFGKTISDRKAWEDLKENLAWEVVINKAETALIEPAVEIPDEVYLQYTKVGTRKEHGDLLVKQTDNLQYLCLAECFENKGRFIAKYEESVKALCSAKAWTINAHDKTLDTFYGRDNYVDLHVATSCLIFVHCDALLGDVVCAEVRKLLRDNIYKRMLNPYMDALHGRRAPIDWMTAKNNWNIVCLASCMGTALALLEDKAERALAITAFLKLGKYGTVSYKDDGYAIEEVGYWGYGYSHFVLGMEIIRQATDNIIDMQEIPKNKEIGLFALRSRISDDTVPCVADCGYNLKPSPINNLYIAKRLGMENLCKHNVYDIGLNGENLYFPLIFWFWNAPVLPHAEKVDTGESLRNYFDSVQVLIARTEKNKKFRMGMFAKGGNNHESHNHLDLGSFVVAVNGETLVADCGCTQYDASTFSEKRYENPIMNSFGHSVPWISGQGQKGVQMLTWADPEIIYTSSVTERNFTDISDSITYDIAKAYDLPFVKSLKRNFVFDRTGDGSVTVTDYFDFTDEQDFEVAFPTYQNVSFENNSILIAGEKVGVRIEFSFENMIFETVVLPPCLQDGPDGKRGVSSPTRVSARINSKQTQGCLKTVITPFEV